MMGKQQRPLIVCLCGSTRFSQAFRDANLRETLAGKIVLSIGCDLRSDDDVFGHLSSEEKEEIKTRLDALHLRKIEMADEVLILNCGQYIGESTRRELLHAVDQGKRIRFLEALPITSPYYGWHCAECGRYILAATGRFTWENAGDPIKLCCPACWENLDMSNLEEVG